MNAAALAIARDWAPVWSMPSIEGRRLRRIAFYRSKLDKLGVERKLVMEDLAEEQKTLDRVNRKVDATEKAQVIIQHVAQELQQRAHWQISDVVGRCLSAVFDDPYDFRINFERKRGKTEAKLEFVRNGVVFDDPMNEIGGGVIDVAAFALRLACILLSRPAKRRLVVLDEPFKNIRGDENKARTRNMLLRLADELGIQFVINTEIPSYQLGRVVEL